MSFDKKGSFLQGRCMIHCSSPGH